MKTFSFPQARLHLEAIEKAARERAAQNDLDYAGSDLSGLEAEAGEEADAAETKEAGEAEKTKSKKSSRKKKEA